MEAAELTGINLKPSMRTSEPSSLQEADRLEQPGDSRRHHRRKSDFQLP
jgi:hypothetical protein